MVIVAFAGPTGASLRVSAIRGAPVGHHHGAGVSAPTHVTAKITMGMFPFNKGGRFNMFGGGLGGGRGAGGQRGGPGGDGIGSSGSGGGREGGFTSSGGGSGGNPVTGVYSLYTSKLASKPLVTKFVTSFIGYSIAGLLIDCCEGFKDNINWVHVAQRGLLGGVAHGLGGHYYYNSLESAMPGVSPLRLFGKTLSDVWLWLPLLAAIRVAVHGVLQESKKPGDAVDLALKTDCVPYLPIWVPASVVMFKYVPVPERIIFHNLVLVLAAALQATLQRTSTTDA